MSPIGFIGLGNMGNPMSTNLAAAGHHLLVYDAAGTAERAPEGARHAASVAEVVAEAEPVFLSLPDGPVVLSVCDEIVAAPSRATHTVVDLSADEHADGTKKPSKGGALKHRRHRRRIRAGHRARPRGATGEPARPPLEIWI